MSRSDDAVVARIASFLQGCAEEGGLTNYTEIADAVADVSPVRLERPFSPLARWLGRIMRNEHRAGRPLLSALVVRRDDGLPGDGFFSEAAHLGLLDRDASEKERQAFWEEQRDALYATWGKRKRIIKPVSVILNDGATVTASGYGGRYNIRVDGPAGRRIAEFVIGAEKDDDEDVEDD